MGKKSGPRPPDPYETAAAQRQAITQSFEDAARFNQIDESGPFGSVRYVGDIGSPNRQRIVELSPADQKRIALQRELGNVLSQRAIDSIDALPGAYSPSDFSADAAAIERATFDRGMNLLRPEFERREKSLTNNLIQQGLPVGSEAYNSAMQSQISDPRREAELALAMDSVAAGRGEQSRLFSLETAQRNQPFVELAQMLSLSPAVQGPQVSPIAQQQAIPTDIAGMIQNNYAQQSQNRNAKKSSTAQLGGTLAAAGMLM